VRVRFLTGRRLAGNCWGCLGGVGGRGPFFSGELWKSLGPLGLSGADADVSGICGFWAAFSVGSGGGGEGFLLSGWSVLVRCRRIERGD